MDTSLRTLLQLAWPIIIARASQAVIGFCDALMTGDLGEQALAAATTGAINTLTLVILPMGVVFIVQSFASQYTGQNDPAGAGRAAWYGIGVAIIAQALALLALPWVDAVHARLAYEPAVTALMTPYIEIRLLAIGPVVGIEALGAWFGGRGNTRPHMQAGLLAMVANVFLNWVLIYGNLGAPALGVEGAAIASSLSSTLAFAWIALLCWRDPASPGSPLRARLSAKEFLRFLRFGLPNGVNWFLEFAAIAVFINVIVAELGTATSAALMVVFNINSVSFMPAFGLASAGAILVGQAIGAGRLDAVPKILLLTAGVAIGWEAAVSVIYAAFPEPLLKLFADQEVSPDLVRIGITILIMSAAWQVFDAITMTVGETLRAAGDTGWVMWARISIAWLFFMPLSWLLVSHRGGDHVAAMLCVILYMVVLSLTLYLRFRSGRWRSISLTAPA